MKKIIFALVTAATMLCSCQKPATSGNDSKQETKTPAELILGKWTLDRRDHTVYVLSSYYNNKEFLGYAALDYKEKGIQALYNFYKDGKIVETFIENGGTSIYEGYYRWINETEFVSNGCEELDPNTAFCIESVNSDNLVLLGLHDEKEDNYMYEVRLYFTKIK